MIEQHCTNLVLPPSENVKLFFSSFHISIYSFSNLCCCFVMMEMPAENLEENDAEIQYHQTPEFLQRKLYFLLEQLKIMHSSLPE